MSWLLAFAGFALLIILHEAGHFAVAKAVGMRVERFALFFPPLIARYRPKGSETEYAIGAIPFGGYVRITGMSPNEEIPPEHAHRAYYRQEVWKRIVVILAGPLVNIFIAFLIFWGLAMNVNYEPTSNVEQIERGWPAATALQPGDKLLAIDGVHGDQDVLREQIAQHTCAGEPRGGCRAAKPAKLLLERDGRRVETTLRPVFDADLENAAGEQIGRMRLGFSFARVNRPQDPVAGAGTSVSTMWRVTSRTVSTLAQLFKPEKREEVNGIVGSYETTRSAVQIGAREALMIIGLISLSLGIINLFPFLPLDGGHIFWALAEKLRGRAIAFSTMERAGFVGFALVLMLFFIGLTNDIERLRGDGFDLR